VKGTEGSNLSEGVFGRADPVAGELAPTGSGPRSMTSAEALKQRPSRLPDHAAENLALIGLAQSLATEPEDILQKLADTALAICRAHSAGLSLLEDGDQRKNFHWRAIAGEFSHHLNGGTPRDFGPCGTVLERNAAQLCSHPEIDFPYFSEAKPPLEEILLVPFYIEGTAVGTIWIVSHDATKRRFDAEDLRVMTNLASFASAAYQTHLTANTSRQFAAIVTSSDDAIISKDLNGIITSWNTGAQRIFGYSAVEIIGKSINILIPADRSDEEPAILQRLRRGERIDHADSHLCRWLLQAEDVMGSDEIMLTQEFLSHMLGVRRTSVSLCAHSLQKSGLIRYSRGKITIVDHKGLEECACECYAAIRQLIDGAIPSK
jgi:PAS domain-containing protein